MIKKQFVYCQVCGERFKTDFLEFDGRVCRPECFDEYEWRMALCITGEDYRQQPREDEMSDDESA